MVRQPVEPRFHCVITLNEVCIGEQIKISRHLDYGRYLRLMGVKTTPYSVEVCLELLKHDLVNAIFRYHAHT